MDPIRILIVDDHILVRDGLSSVLGREADMTVVGEASNGLEAIEETSRLKPDVVLMDLRMPELDGVEAMKRIAESDPTANVLVLTTFDTDEYIFQAIEAGAKGFLLKDASHDELYKAVRAVSKGESLIEPGVAARVLSRFVELAQNQASPVDILSEREMDVLHKMASGNANKEIAAQLELSESTIKTHVARIFQKLDVNDRTSAVTQAIRRGIISV